MIHPPLALPTVTIDGNLCINWLGTPVLDGEVYVSPNRQRNIKVPSQWPKPDIERGGLLWRIVAATAAAHRIPTRDILSRRQTNRIRAARREAMYMARKITGQSYPAIGRAFGRDHGSIQQACGRVLGMMDGEVERRLEGIRARVGQSGPALGSAA